MKRLLLFCAMILPMALHAQNQLVPAPDAVKLRRVWTQEGKELTGDEYGYNVWGGTDISGDSIADFGVYRKSVNTWLFYRGGNPPETTPFLEIDSIGPVPPYIAHFFGDDRRLMVQRSGYVVDTNDYRYYYDILRLHAVTDGSVESTPTISYDQGRSDPPIERFINHILVADVNNDATEDLIVTMSAIRIGQDRFGGDATPQAWIYLGGENFRLDTPTIIIRDTGIAGRPENWQVRFADFDGDGRTDMVMGGDYPGAGEMLRFYWGDENSPGSWAERNPDRDLRIVPGQTGVRLELRTLDTDGDGAEDLTGYSQQGDDFIVYLYRTGTGKNARTRSFAIDDADLAIANGANGRSRLRFGAMNDSSGRYEMWALGRDFGDDRGVALISGSSSGPDTDFEADYYPDRDGLFNENMFLFAGGNVGDVTGDGWSDAIVADHTDGPFVNTGIAFVLAGGPYIPFDDPSSVVDEYPVAGESTGLYLWPNPVVDELHIAWKGNLKRMPARFEVVDMEGKVVVEGEVDPYRGAAVWQCADVASGVYVLSMYGDDDQPISTAEVRKL